jgi:hypothetical protein
MKVAGIDPASVYEPTDSRDTTYAKEVTCRAALGLQLAGSGCLFSSPLDPRLVQVVAAWQSLPDNIRIAIAKLCEH